MFRFRSLIFLLAGSLLIVAGLSGGAWATSTALRLQQTVPTPTPPGTPVTLPTATPDEPPPATEEPPTATPTTTTEPSEDPSPPGTPEPSDTPEAEQPGTPPPADPPADAPPTPEAPDTNETTETPAPLAPEDTAPATPDLTSAVEVSLRFNQEVQPNLAQAGQVLTYTLTLENLGPGRAVHVRVRNHFIDELQLLSARADKGRIILEGQVVTMLLSELAPLETVNVTVNVQVAGDTPDGVVLDNIAEARAANAEPVSAGSSVGMPPAYLPPTGADREGG